MADDILADVPAPLLRQLVDGRWLPIVGAGFSRNAVVPFGDPPPDWKGLGRQLALDMPDLEYDSPLDAVSAYQQAFDRRTLTDRVSSLLRINDARPSAAHISFARLGFENVITTNFDMLLEKAYDSVQRTCQPLIEESQLSNRNIYPGPRLLKLHGDLNHPQRLILTEEDYDTFLGRYPLLATSVSSLLIDHTAILVGYSLDDPDLRQILSIIRDRLGNLAPALWAIQVDAPLHVVRRFERRGVRVINLTRKRGATYGGRLQELFEALHRYWSKELIDESNSTDERALADLQLPSSSSTICFFAAPLQLLSWYREFIFPIVEGQGYVPVTSEDVLTPPGTLITKIDALIQRAALVIVDIMAANALFEVGLALNRSSVETTLLIADESTYATALPFDVAGLRVIVRPADLTEAADTLGREIADWLGTKSRVNVGERGESEPERLLAAKEYRAALIAAVALLETRLGSAIESDLLRRMSLTEIVRTAASREVVNHTEMNSLVEVIRLRNAALHQGAQVTERQASEAVRVAMEVVRRLSRL